MTSMSRSSLVAMLVGLAVVVGVTVQLTAQGRGAALDRAAPEIAGGPWINSQPLTVEALRGRVVYVEFWTYG
jgi:hypothetical protein